MKIIGIIPARYGSTRFPGKPLVDIHGKPMIRRVYEQASKAVNIQTVVVATDDARIEACVKGFGGHVVMTSPTHPSGTDRCFEAYEKVAGTLDQYDVVINIQGDEPYIHPGQIDEITACFQDDGVNIATLVRQMEDVSKLTDPNTVKVVFDQHQRALYFSRSPVPFSRDGSANPVYYRHVGMYAFRPVTLAALVQLPESALEKVERLEQLRWLEHGFSIHVGFTQFESISVDTPGDLLTIDQQKSRF